MSAGAAPSSARLLSLDVVRGIAIAGMLLVNNPGSWEHIYAPLQHAAWHGWTPTDLIFPFFIFIVGVAVTYSLRKANEQRSSRRDLMLKTAKRALLLFLVGLALHSFPWWGYDYAHLRIPGVLQRIAIAYLVAAVIYLYTDVRGQIAAIVALLLDIKGYRKWSQPFLIFGSNAIAAYVLSSLGALTLELIKVGDDGASLKTYIFTKLYTSWLAPIDASLLFAISYVLFWLAIMAVLYSKRIFIKL